MTENPGHTPHPSEQFLELADVIRFFSRHKILILGLAVTAAVATAAVVLLVLPPRYEASATLVVVPPKFSSELKPHALSVQGYQRLLESDAVIGETNRKLVEEGLLAPRDGLEVGNQLVTRIFVSRRAEETALAPIIEAVGYADTAEKAATIANTWALTFLAHSRQLMVGTTLPTVEFIETQYGNTQTKLEELDALQVETADDYQEQLNRLVAGWDRRLDELTLSWDRQLVAFKKSSEDQVAAYQSATRGRLGELAADHGLFLGNGDGSPAPRAGVADGEPASPAGLADGRDPAARAVEPAAVDGELRQGLLELANLRVQLAQTPQFLLIEKAVTDDALWQAMALSQTRLFELQPLVSRNLLSQEVNPVYTALALRVAEVETGLEADFENVPAAVAVPAREIVAELERLQRERSAGLAKLFADRALELGAMQRSKFREIEEMRRQKELEQGALERQRTMTLVQIERDIAHQRALFDELADNFHQAALARTEESLVDVRLGSRAQPPYKPKSRRLAMITALAALFGGLAGFLIGLVREINEG